MPANNKIIPRQSGAFSSGHFPIVEENTTQTPSDSRAKNVSCVCRLESVVDVGLESAPIRSSPESALSLVFYRLGTGSFITKPLFHNPVHDHPMTHRHRLDFALLYSRNWLTVSLPIVLLLCAHSSGAVSSKETNPLQRSVILRAMSVFLLH